MKYKIGMNREKKYLIHSYFLLEFKIKYTAFFQYSVCGVPGFDFSIYSNIATIYGAVPNVMITFAVSDKMTPMIF